MIGKALLILRRHGLWGSIKLIPKNIKRHVKDDSNFDEVYGVSTSTFVPISKLTDVDSAKLTDAVGYEPTAPETFYQMIDDLPISPQDYSFIDLGAGKGRVLIMAHDRDFANVVGVEFSGELCEIARQNISGRPISIQHSDARDYEFPNEPLVLYMFNPFNAAIMQTVIDRIIRSIEVCPRDVWVIYHYPHHRALFTSHFSLIREGWGYCIFRAKQSA